jgi:hypothetical protein
MDKERIGLQVSRLNVGPNGCRGVTRQKDEANCTAVTSDEVRLG